MNWRISNKVWNWLAILLLIFILGRFVTQGYARAITNSNSSIGDQGAFLQLGLDLREKGILTDGTRNPLYVFFLTPLANRDWSYFSQAKLLSIAFGLAAIIALFFLGRRFFNLFTGLAAAYLLSINVEFIVHSATALTESLLVLTFILAWFAMIKALNAPRQWPYWALAGALTGLAYLAKGSGQLLAFAFLVTAFWLVGLEGFSGLKKITASLRGEGTKGKLLSILRPAGSFLRRKEIWAFVAAYILVASPLWIYNTIHFGSPTFNYAITHQMWMERWTDWHPDSLDNLPTALTYLQTHSLSEIVEREWTGMKALRNILVKTLWPTRTLKVDRFLLSPLSSYVFLLLALLPVIFWRSSRHYIRQYPGVVYLTGLTALIFFILFSWYVQIIAGTRFLLPIIPLIFVVSAHITTQVWQKIAGYGSWIKGGLVLATAIVVVYQLRWAVQSNAQAYQTFLNHDLFAHDREFGQDAATPLEWLVNGSPKNSKVAWGPSGHSLPIWAYSDRLDFQNYPPGIDTITELTERLVQQQVAFVIVDPDMVARHRSLLKEQFPSDETRIEVTTIPPGWALTYAYRDMPCNWCIFRLLASNPFPYEVDYRIGQTIRLVGYDLDRLEFQPGDTVHLTLHWQATAALDEDYTVFSQLLGPDFQLHGQLDRQPVDGLWPTSRWRAGEPIADRYDIPLDLNAPPGQYRILVGMYNWQTGQRQPVTHDGKPVPVNAFYLRDITIASP